MTLREYAKLMNDTALQGSLSIEEYNRLYKPLLDGIQSMIPPMLFRYRSCNELSLQALWDDKIWLSKGNVMNDDYDALLYFDKAKITAHVLQAINEFSRFASGKVSWEELPQIVQYFFPREVLCQMREAIAHITVGDMESYLRHFEAFSRNAIKAYSPKISVLTQNTLKFACFSDTITSANMWGHYASSSTGFSIGYNFRGFPSIMLFSVIVIYAVGGCILSGIFSVGETKSLETLSAKIHGYGSVIGFLLLTLAPLFVGLYFFKVSNGLLGILSLICFIFAIVFFALFVMADKPNYRGTIIAFEGLWQRLSLLSMYLPIAALCIFQK